MIIDGSHLHAEIVNARKQLESRRADMRHIVEGMAGRASTRKDGSVQRLIENHYHQYAALLVPRMYSGDARVRITTPRGGIAKLKALAGELGVNEWTKRTNHRALAQRLATDSVLGWGVAALHLERRSGFDDDDDDPVAWPTGTRIDQGDAWWDPLATSWPRKAYAGYHYVTTPDELLERSRTEPGWNRGVIKNLPLDAGLEEIDRPKDAPRRGEVVIREMWIPGFKLPNAPKHTNGTIFTLGVSSAGTGKFVREPQPFFGPPWGPLYLYDIYYVPGQSLGMSPCEAVMAQVEELNAQANKLSMAIARRKKLLLGRKMDAEDNHNLANAIDGGHVLMTGFDNNLFKEYEYGGPSQSQQASIESLLERLYRNSGLDDAARGLATTGVTATATATASATSGMRSGYVAQRFADCDEQLLRGVHWYLCHSRAVKIHISPEDMGITPELLEQRGMDPALLATMEATITGGPDDGLSYEDYTLTLDRYSVEKVSEGLAQQRAMQWAQAQMQLAQIAPAISSYTDVGALSRAIDEAFNRSSGDLINADAAAQLAGQQAAQQSEDESDDVEYEPTENATPMTNPMRKAAQLT